MCLSCVASALFEDDPRYGTDDDIDWTALALERCAELGAEPPVAALAERIRAWYQLPGNGVGGVLHVQLDDFNLDDDLLHVTTIDPATISERYRQGVEDGQTPEMLAEAQAIVDALAALDEARRHVAAWNADPYARGSLA